MGDCQTLQFILVVVLVQPGGQEPKGTFGIGSQPIHFQNLAGLTDGWKEIRNVVVLLLRSNTLAMTVLKDWIASVAGRAGLGQRLVEGGGNVVRFDFLHGQGDQFQANPSRGCRQS